MPGSPANSEPQSFDAVLFDMDGTLVDSADLVVQEWRIWADFHGIDLDQILAIAHGRRSEEVIRLIAPHLSPSEELKRFQDAAIRLDQSAVRAVPGAVELIAALPRDRWALVTSAPGGMARERLIHAGLPVPEVLISADDVRAGKPDPEGFLAAAKRLKVEPSRCLVFEDAPAGLEAARRAGMRSIALTTTHTREQLAADSCIPDYSALHVSYSDADGIVVIHRN